MIDGIDEQILNIIQSSARSSNVDMARVVGLAPSAVLERIRKLEERGIIQSYEARLDAAKLGLGLVAFIFVKTDDRIGHRDTAQRLARLPEVLEVHHIAGEDCFLIKVRTKDTAALGHLLRKKLGTIRSIISTRTTIVLETVKESGILPLPSAPSAKKEPRSV